LVILAAMAGTALADAPVAGQDQKVQARLIADAAVVAPGAAVRVGVLLTMAPAWHIYWRNPGDGGLATSVEWRLPAGLTAGALAWPLPERFVDPSGQITTFGYEGQVLLWTAVRIPAGAQAGQTVELAAKVLWLVCSKDQCVPGDAEVKLTLPVEAAVKPDNAEVFRHWEGLLPVDGSGPDSPAEAAITGRLGPDPGEAGTAAPPATAGASGTGQFHLSVHWKRAADGEVVEVFPAAQRDVDVAGVRVASMGPDARSELSFRVRALKGVGPPPKVLPIVLAYRDDRGVRRGVTFNVPLEIEP
jgi:hypothetical protein